MAKFESAEMMRWTHVLGGTVMLPWKARMREAWEKELQVVGLVLNVMDVL